MIQLKALTSFLINLDLVAAEQVESWVENPKMILSGKQISADSILLFKHEYDAVISIERFPHERHDINLLFGHVCAWLMTNDCDRDEISEPITDVDILDNDTADVEIKISFIEDIEAVEDIAGPIVLDGVAYNLAPAVIDVAEVGEVDEPAGVTA